MRLIIADCAVEYAGRLSTKLPRARRLIMLKADGSFLIHADDGSYKPLNWILAPCTLQVMPPEQTQADRGAAEVSLNAAEASGAETELTRPDTEVPREVWRVTHAKTVDMLVVSIYEIISDSVFELGSEPGLQKDGVEVDLQKLLAQQIHLVEEGCELIRREYLTTFGPVDILARSQDGITLAVEIKRKADIDGVEQLTRYVEQLNKDPLLKPVKGILAAQSFAARARILAKERGLRCLTLNYEQMREDEQEVETDRLF